MKPTPAWSWFGLTVVALLAGAPEVFSADGPDLTAAQKGHWAWKPPARHALPAVRTVGWTRNPVDEFVLAKLEAAGLVPAQPARREHLLRRVCFDLIGLPPTPEEIDAFVNDPAPDAYEKVVNRLLASPHYGERWGRHWLDVARFAESNGYEFDEVRPEAWRYRDYVIHSFNADKPYDRFIREQLAGDELAPEDPDALTATGFNLLGPDMTDSSDQAQRRLNTLNDMTDTAALAFLGLTLACARCHDHKFEPLPQLDYYRFQAFFAPAVFRRDLTVATPEDRRRHAEQERRYQEQAGELLARLATLETPHRQRLFESKLSKLSPLEQEAHRTPEEQRTGAQQELVADTLRRVTVTAAEIQKSMSEAERTQQRQLKEQLKTFDPLRPAPLPVAMGLTDATTVPKTYLLERGEKGNRGEEVVPGIPCVLAPGFRPQPTPVEPAARSTGRRGALAQWLTRPDHPLTARVLVNRIWQHHFGRGLVRTASDFGTHAEPPTHPELLDWLAVEFVENGWSIKHLHRLLLTSATYQQSVVPSPNAAEKDPDNDLFSRMNRLRLEGEIVRDNLLAVSGRLNTRLGGPGVFPPIPAEALKGAKGWTVSPDPRDHVRRSVYVFARRNLRFPFLEAFDLPDSNLSCPRREQSTTAPQALALLNSADAVTAAQALAEQVERDAAPGDERTALAFRRALGRRPTEQELEWSREFLAGSSLSELCRALLNLNEFVYLD